MSDALISELRERAVWARAELNQATAVCMDKAADALEEATKDIDDMKCDIANLLKIAADDGDAL